MLFQGKELYEIQNVEILKWLPLAFYLLTTLYIFELIYRVRFGWPLFVHHLLTVFFIQLLTASFHDAPSIYIMRLASIFGFFASFEQTSFIALLEHFNKVNSLLVTPNNKLMKHNQTFVINPDVTVGQAAKDAGAEILGFVRLEVGEGIEKKEEDFAAEVAAAVAG